MSTERKTVPAVVPEVLNVNQVAVIRTKDGKIAMFKSSVSLSTADGTLVNVPGMGKKIDGGGWQPTYLVSAMGYAAMASRSGLVVLNAPTVVVDGQVQQNPHIVRDSGGRVMQVYCRSICFGYTAMGQPAASDRTAVFDLGLYRLVDLVGKAKKVPQAFRILPADHDRPGPLWARYGIDEATTLWVDTSAQEYIEWQGQMLNRAKKAAEFAQSFAQRNAIKHHPNIRVHTSATPSTAAQVLCWRPVEGTMRWDMSKYELLIGQAAEITGGRDVQVTQGSDNLHEDVEMIKAESGAAPDEDDQPEDQGQGSDAPASAGNGAGVDPVVRDVEIMRNIEAMIQTLPKAQVKAAYRAAGLADTGELLEMLDSAKLIELQKLLAAAMPKK